MDRRQFCRGVTALGLLPSVAAAEMNGAQLLLVRQTPEPVSCVKNGPRYIVGKLYGVPSQLDLATADPTLGLHFLSDTMELPYEANAQHVSSIPAGIYRATVRVDKTKEWMTSTDRTWRLELMGVPNRSVIQFHFGTNYTWSKGCIILTGNANEDLMCRNAVTSSEQSVLAVRQFVEANTLYSTDSIQVRIDFLG